MKDSRFKTAYRSNSSKLHKKIGDCLRAEGSPFACYNIYQEYPVNKVNPKYSNGAHKFDWVVLSLKLVIEGHGAQHYQAVQFGGIDNEEAQDRLLCQRVRDRQKAQACVDAGFTYVEIPYTDVEILTPAYLYAQYREHFNDATVEEEEKVETDYQQKLKERARQYRQQQYRRAKKCLDAIKSSQS